MLLAIGGSLMRPTSRISGRWTYQYRAIDQHGQVIDVLLAERRNAHAARSFFTRALSAGALMACAGAVWQARFW